LLNLIFIYIFIGDQNSELYIITEILFGHYSEIQKLKLSI